MASMFRPAPPPPASVSPRSSTASSSSTMSTNTTTTTTTSSKYTFDEATSPSRKRGISASEERTRRRRACQFIEQAASALKLPNLVIATATFYFHHYYAVFALADKHTTTNTGTGTNTPNTDSEVETATACLLLAAKTEESPKKLSTILRECHGVRHSNKKPTIDPTSDEYARYKESVLRLERVLLHTVAFEISIDHPYKPILEKVHALCDPKDPCLEWDSAHKDPKKLTGELSKNSIKFANSSLSTTLCLQHSACNVAMGCVFMSAAILSIKPKNGKSWLDLLGIDHGVLTSITNQIMGIIAEKKGEELEFFKKIRAELKSVQEPPSKRQKTTKG